MPVILEIGELLTKKIKGAKKVILSDVAHHLNMEKPEEFNHVVLGFLSGL